MAKAAVQRKLADARALLPPALSAPAPPGVRALRAAQGHKALAFARAEIGKPYVWGAAGPGSYDSSGLSQAAWKAAGVALPRGTREQSGAGTPVPLTDALPGDLVFFRGGTGQVGVYAGDGIMIHAPRPGARVRAEPVLRAGAPAIHRVVRPA
ncbi:C40 family peptidase [Streptomyces sp. NPDC021356]|uniref:C40 family peptidase n=1 Tax=Streptomyces sp. NPDC021356 TaxID=3154900 RepID=UPI0033D3F322